MRMIISAILAMSVLAGAASAVGAKTPLRNVKEIDNEMLWVALALRIGKKCDEISPRTVKGYSVLYGLKSRAQKLGYTGAEINAYVKNDDEKARRRVRRDNYVKSKGLNPSDPAALCSLGHAEIARSSKIGVLLKAK